MAAVAHGLDDGLDERLARARTELTEWAARDPWVVESDDVRTILLAALVRAEQIEYGSYVSDRGTPMLLRDALTDPEDLATIAAMVRWETLMRLSVTFPDDLLRSWRKHVSSIARGDRTWDPSEYGNTLGIRRHLQQFSAALSWIGQAQWREHVEPVDDAFRACTERQDVALMLTPDGGPGSWWEYRVPVGAAAECREWALRNIEPARYVAGPTGSGRSGSLRTISHVFELAERPYGLRAMTDRELEYWRRFCGRQAGGQGGDEAASPSWRALRERAEEERRRRASETAG